MPLQGLVGFANATTLRDMALRMGMLVRKHGTVGTARGGLRLLRLSIGLLEQLAEELIGRVENQLQIQKLCM